MVAKKFTIAKQMGGKRIISNKGEELGRLSDIAIDERSGKIEALLVEPNVDSKLARQLTGSERMIVVPYKSGFAVSDVIVVDESLIA